MRRLILLIVLTAVAAAAAATAFAAAPDTKRMVLRLGDLPAGFSLVKSYSVDNALAVKQSKSTTAADFQRWGRITGYEADFSRVAITGLIVINSNVGLYKTSVGARDSLRDSFATATKPNRFDGQLITFKRVSIGSSLGQEARMYTAQLSGPGINVTLFAVVWRYKTVKASLLTGGLQGTVDAKDAATLAKKQQARIVAALR